MNEPKLVDHYAEAFYLTKESQELPSKGWDNTLNLINTLTDNAARIFLDLLLGERIKDDEIQHIDYCIPYDNENDLISIIELEQKQLISCVWLEVESQEDSQKWIRKFRELPF